MYYSGLKEGLNMALEAQGENSRKKWGWIMKDYNDLVGSSNAAIGSSSDANAVQVNLPPFSPPSPILLLPLFCFLFFPAQY